VPSSSSFSFLLARRKRNGIVLLEKANDVIQGFRPHATPSSGKTLMVASTYGNKETDCVVDGKKVIVGVNAYIPKK
jgi:hypothetical protein